jgi:hypothetical protein
VTKKKLKTLFLFFKGEASLVRLMKTMFFFSSKLVFFYRFGFVLPKSREIEKFSVRPKTKRYTPQEKEQGNAVAVVLGKSPHFLQGA